jgi:hypothetical protein
MTGQYILSRAAYKYTIIFQIISFRVFVRAPVVQWLQWQRHVCLYSQRPWVSFVIVSISSPRRIPGRFHLNNIYNSRLDQSDR